MHLVQFPDGRQWKPENQLELVTSERLNPLEMLSKQKLGRPIDLRKTLTHAKITGKLADVIYSMEATNTDFYAYQFKPVLKILESPSNGILVADEVGLGKTIEAGLIWTELRSRFDMRRLIVVCPSALCEKWQTELSSKIGIRAAICDTRETLRILSDSDEQDAGFAIICSLQGLRPPKDWEDSEDLSAAGQLARFLREHENDDRLADLLVIDEAHHLRNPETRTNELGQLLKPVCEFTVLLTATPIHNRNEDLYSLLKLLDPDTFSRKQEFGQILEANSPLVRAKDMLLSQNPDLQRLKLLVSEAMTNELLANNRQLSSIKTDLKENRLSLDHITRSNLAYRLETINLLAHVITRTRKRDVKEWRVVRQPFLELVPMARDPEGKVYDMVTSIVTEYAMRSEANERFLLSQPQRQMTSCMAAALTSWRNSGEQLEEAILADPDVSMKTEIGPLVQTIIRQTKAIDIENLRENDSKYQRLTQLLEKFFRNHPDEKVVLFSSFRSTLTYLKNRLDEEGFKTILLMGGQSETKQSVIGRFRGAPGSTTLLTSEVGGEGVDIQFCRVLINYDLPWNPMRLEQRIGRIDRLGQKADSIQIWNIMYDNTIDARIYTRLYDKLDLVRVALGDFEAILGEKIRILTIDLLSGELSPEAQNARIEQTAMALENIRREEEQLENEAASLIAYGDYILDRIHQAKSLHRWILGEDIRRYVSDHLSMKYPGSVFQLIDQAKRIYNITLSKEARYALTEYIRRVRSSYSTRLTSTLSKSYKYIFDNRVTHDLTGAIETISQFHPLVKMVNDEMSEGGEQLTPAISAILSKEKVKQIVEPGVYMVAIAKWSFSALQNVDKLAYKACSLRYPDKVLQDDAAEILASMIVSEGKDWLEVSSEINFRHAEQVASDILFAKLWDDYEEFEARLKERNEDRADLQIQMLDRHLENQVTKLQDILENHEAKGRLALAEATRGRVRALENRVEQQRMRINEHKNMRSNSEDIGLAIVSVR